MNFFYKKKDIIAIQEKLGMVPLGPINDNINQTALNQSKKGKKLEIRLGCCLIWWRN